MSIKNMVIKEADGTNKNPWTSALIWAVIASAVGSGFPHGYNTGVINPPKEVISGWTAGLLNRTADPNHPDPMVTFVWSIVVSIMCVGGMIGGLCSGLFISIFGPKKSLLLNNGILVIAIVLEGFSKHCSSYIMLIIGRFITGVNAGIATGVCPMYLSMISPVKIRGTTASVYQLVVTISILVSQIVSLKKLMGSEDLWPYLFWGLLIIVVFQLIALAPCPESPVFLYNKGQELQAEAAIKKLRNSDDVAEEMEAIKAEKQESESMERVTFKDLFRSRLYRRPTIIIIVIMLAQQLSGINAIMYFSTEIFGNSGLTEDQSQIATICMGLVNVLMTIVSVSLVDMVGRKVLLLVGFAGMFVCTLSLTVAMTFANVSIIISYFCIALVMLFVIFFAAGAGSIPWFLVCELYYPNARASVTSISICVNWTANFLVGLLFLPLKDWIGAYVFIIFSVLQLIFFIFILILVPETKDRSVEEIYAEFRRRTYGE